MHTHVHIWPGHGAACGPLGTQDSAAFDQDRPMRTLRHANQSGQARPSFPHETALDRLSLVWSGVPMASFPIFHLLSSSIAHHSTFFITCLLEESKWFPGSSASWSCLSALLKNALTLAKSSILESMQAPLYVWVVYSLLLGLRKEQRWPAARAHLQAFTAWFQRALHGRVNMDGFRN